jgi:hypothetical protein
VFAPKLAQTQTKTAETLPGKRASAWTAHKPDIITRGFMKPRFGHDFGKLPLHWDAQAAEPARDVNALGSTEDRSAPSGKGQLQSGTTPQPPADDTPPAPMDKPAVQAPTDDTGPTPLQTPPAKGPAITVTNGWANPAGKTDRTTVGIGELSSFVVSDKEGGSWKSADNTGKTVNSVTFTWTAGSAGTNTITYTAADKTTSSVTMNTVAPASLSGKKDKDLTYPAGTQGAGMELTLTALPTTVSFQALEIMEQTVNASAASGYFASHAPGAHNAAAGAGNWSQLGPNNDTSDTADSSGWPSPWSKGSFTWAIPVSWRMAGSTKSTAFSATSDQVVTIGGTDGTTTVTKLGAATTPRKP